MSNRRRPLDRNYRSGYLRSPAWFRRRDAWFAQEEQHGRTPRCALCRRAGTPHHLHLHHLDYRGVTRTAAGWTAGERHRDLIALHPRCHELLHLLIDRDRVLAKHRSRRVATWLALARLRTLRARPAATGASDGRR